MRIYKINVRRPLALAFAAAAVFLSSCQKKVENTNIPSRGVSFIIDVSLSGTDAHLVEGNVMSSKIYTKTSPAQQSYGTGSYGYGGVVVVRTLNDELAAFDICCPYEVDASVVIGDADDYIMECPKCGSEFEVGNGYGNVFSGPAAQPLKQYNVTRLGSERYLVSN